MNMQEHEFWDCTPRYFMLRRKAWLEDRQGMERARFIAFYVIKTVDSKNRVKRLTDLAQFPWDKAARPKHDWEPFDQAEMDKFSAEADEALRVLNPEAYAKYMAGKNKH